MKFAPCDGRVFRFWRATDAFAALEFCLIANACGEIAGGKGYRLLGTTILFVSATEFCRRAQPLERSLSFATYGRCLMLCATP